MVTSEIRWSSTGDVTAPCLSGRMAGLDLAGLRWGPAAMRSFRDVISQFLAHSGPMRRPNLEAKQHPPVGNWQLKWSADAGCSLTTRPELRTLKI